MLKIETTTQFRKDLKLAKRRKKNISELQRIMNLITERKPLPSKLKDHPLSGNWQNFRELHIEPDWLLIYKLAEMKKVIFTRTGTHSDLFE